MGWVGAGLRHRSPSGVFDGMLAWYGDGQWVSATLGLSLHGLSIPGETDEGSFHTRCAHLINVDGGKMPAS